MGGMTLRDFRVLEKDDVHMMFVEAKILVSKMAKFRLLHKGR